MPLKIVLLQQHYFPEMAGVARRAKELSESFVKLGYSVTVFTSYPRDFRSMPDYDISKIEVINGVNVIRSKTIFNVGKITLFRMLSYLFYVIKCVFFLFKNKKKYDIILSMAPLPPAIAGGIANIFLSKYHHFDVPDILPDLGISAGMIKNKFLIKILFSLEKWVYDNSNSISAITHGQIKNIISKGVSSKKIYYLPDWINIDFFEKNLEKYKNEIIEKWNFNDKTVISFIGNIGALQNPSVFIDVMADLDENGFNNFHFLFIGDGIKLDLLKKKAKKLKLKNVDFIGRVKRKYIPSYMSLSDILVANYLPNNYMDICVPGKLFEYAISNKPLVMGSNGEAKELIKEYKLGVSVKPSSVDEFKNAFIKLSDKSYIHKPNLSLFCKKFSLDTISNKYIKIFSNLKYK